MAALGAAMSSRSTRPGWSLWRSAAGAFVVVLRSGLPAAGLRAGAAAGGAAASSHHDASAAWGGIAQAFEAFLLTPRNAPAASPSLGCGLAIQRCARPPLDPWVCA